MPDIRSRHVLKPPRRSTKADLFTVDQFMSQDTAYMLYCMFTRISVHIALTIVEWDRPNTFSMLVFLITELRVPCWSTIQHVGQRCGQTVSYYRPSQLPTPEL